MGQNQEKMTVGQGKGLAIALASSAPTDYTFEEAALLIGTKTSRLQGVIGLALEHLLADLQLEDKFEQSNRFDIIIPKDYQHDISLALFHKNFRQDFFQWNEYVADQYFQRTTNHLIPGRQYTVSIYRIKNNCSFEVCLSFIALKKGLLVSAQGLAVIFSLQGRQLPIGNMCLSLDAKENLFRNRSESFYAAGIDWHDENHSALCLMDVSKGLGNLQSLIVVTPA